MAHDEPGTPPLAAGLGRRDDRSCPAPVDRPSWHVPSDTSSELVKTAEATSGQGLRIEFGGGTIEEEGAPPEVLALIAATAILLIAFGSIAAAGLPLLTALFGLGLASAIFLDAVVIRLILLAAVLELFGERIWWFPRRLDRHLPRIAADPSVERGSAPPLPASGEATR